MRTKYIIDNLSGQTINGNPIDPKYKVYTALLTQSGGTGPSMLNDEPLTIGVTYQITDQGGSGWDFTNVGAPNNNENTYFVATGTTPNSWGDLGVSLNFNTGAPVVTVLENTIGNIWFTYNVEGNYNINSNDLFTATKTVSPNSQTACFNSGSDSFYNLIIQYQTGDYMELLTINDGFATLDNQLTNKMIEIRVYN